ncbi:MAG: ATP-binding protein [Nitrospirota bacterium]|nr:ATP-binding protein [Nitrospirota bacterium]
MTGIPTSIQERPVLSTRHAVLLAGIFLALYAVSRTNYLLMHTLVEMFSIVVACSIFLIAWNTRRFVTNTFFLVIGVSLLFVGVLDLVHTLSYKGLNVFPGYGANLPTQLWIASRYLIALSFLAALLAGGRTVNAYAVLAGYGAVTAALLVTIFSGRFPDCFVEGQGLTAFKVWSEFAVSLLFAGTLVLFYRLRRTFEPAILGLLAGSVVASIVSELLFSLYIGVYDIFNLLGHFCKVLSFYLIYKALIETALVRPYALLFRQISNKTRELERSNEELEQFASIITHDLNAPLNTIGMCAQVLQEKYDDQLGEQGRKYTESIVQGTRRMARMVTGVLEYSRISRKAVTFEQVSLDATLAAAHQNLRSRIDEAGAVVEAGPLPRVRGNEVQLVQVFQNIIGNAVQYRGAEPLRIRVTADRNGNREWRITVEDNGVGIAPVLHERIFRIFDRGGQAESEGNSGIGLALCKKIVERHGGRINVASEPGKGAQFRFTLRAGEQEGG